MRKFRVGDTIKSHWGKNDERTDVIKYLKGSDKATDELYDSVKDNWAILEEAGFCAHLDKFKLITKEEVALMKLKR